MVKAARDAGRTVQIGTHRRVSPHNMSAHQVPEGRKGRQNLHGPCVRPLPPADRECANPIPTRRRGWIGTSGVDRPHSSRSTNDSIRRDSGIFPISPTGCWETGGIHWLDQILWWTEEKTPKAVYSTGARHVMRDNSDLPDTQIATFEFESFTALWEHRRCAGAFTEKHNIGLCFYGTEGTVHLGWLDGWTFYPRNSSKKGIHEKPQLHDPDKQNIPELWADFLSSIESGKRPICDIEVGHRYDNDELVGYAIAKAGSKRPLGRRKGANPR